MSFKWAGVTFDQFPSGLFAPIQSMGLGGLLGGLLGQSAPAQQQMYAQQSFQQALTGQMQNQQAMSQFAAAGMQNQQTQHVPGLTALFSNFRSFVVKPQADEFDDPMDFDIAMYEWRGSFEQED